MKKYFSKYAPNITIENNEIKGLDSFKYAAQFNDVMKRIQINEGIDLDYRIDRRTRARLTEEVAEEQDN